MPVDKTRLFRQAALDKMSSPEQLDVLMEVTSSRSWIALVGLGAVLVTALTWSVVGTLPSKVQAQAILVKPGGVFDVFATGFGLLEEVMVAEGDVVAPNQVVARIAQPDLTRELADARAQRDELLAQHAELTTFTARDLDLRANSQALQAASLRETITFAEERLGGLREQIANQELLLEKGLITKQSLLLTRQESFATQDMLEQSRSQLRQMSVENLATTTRTQQDVVQSELRMAEAERQIERLTQQLDMQSTVRSPYAGRVLEVKRDGGDVIGTGSPVLSLQLSEQDAEGLQVVIYIPPKNGKNVRQDMPVQISPVSIAKEEFGFLVGTVTYVSEFPATSDGMMRVLGNASLIETLSTDGPPYIAYADLAPDSESASGYRWSSPKGNVLRVDSGTLCEVSVTVRERRPIELVIPVLRGYLGL